MVAKIYKKVMKLVAPLELSTALKGSAAIWLRTSDLTYILPKMDKVKNNHLTSFTKINSEYNCHNSKIPFKYDN